MSALTICVGVHLSAVYATEIAGVTQKTFFTRKIARKLIHGPYVDPVSLLFLLKLTRSFTEK